MSFILKRPHLWRLCLLLLPALLLCLPSNVFAQETIADLKALIDSNQAAHQESMNHIWTMVAAALVFFMQAGFLLLEAGMVRSKNSINVAEKNIVDFLIAFATFYFFGFAIMFGHTFGGWIGWDSTLALFDGASDWNYTFFVFQAVFAGTAATIVSGAVAERMKFTSYIIMTVVIAVLIYPIVGHWAWANLLYPDNHSYFTDKGFIDFAGSTVVHSVGGWVALACCLVLGPRIGRFNPQTGEANHFEGHNLVLSATGCVILWVGWIGFNGGSTTVGDPAFAHIIFNTLLASVLGGLVALIIGRIQDGAYRPDQVINGVLGGLVAITAGCDAVDVWGAAIIGGAAGLVVHLATNFITNTLKVDDVVGAIPVHGFCGLWGTISLAFFATPAALGDNTMLDQLSIQAQGALAAFVWAFGTAYILARVADAIFGLRVSEEDELEGLNSAEHHSNLAMDLLQQHLNHGKGQTAA